MLCMAAAALLAGVSYQKINEAQKCSCSHCWAHSTGNSSSSGIKGQGVIGTITTDRPSAAIQTVLTYIASSSSQSSSATNSSTERVWEVVPDLSQRTEDALPDVAARVVELEKQGKGRKIIAYSLFGDNPKYIQVGLVGSFEFKMYLVLYAIHRALCSCSLLIQQPLSCGTAKQFCQVQHLALPAAKWSG
jgi:hypothetical protein